MIHRIKNVRDMVRRIAWVIKKKKHVCLAPIPSKLQYGGCVVMKDNWFI